MSSSSPLPTLPETTTTTANALSRTPSMGSIAADDPRRSRKRFTNAQLVMLEQLFYQTSHPTREEREAVAQAAGMEIKSVTIWFQNKRQTERKVALHHAASQSNADGHRLAPLLEHSPSPVVAVSTPPSLVSARSPHVTPRRRTTPPRPRPSLDRVATRSEARIPPPRTPTRPRDPFASPWDNMPSSPLAPPASPPAREFVDFVGNGRSLEWACAAARLAGKQGRLGVSKRALGGDGDAGDETEDEEFEAITPQGSFDVACGKVGSLHEPRVPQGSVVGEGKAEAQDDDTMRAALALCGLGRRP